ncbi:flavin-dependent oxidoreductase [Amycolatopsis japonica]
MKILIAGAGIGGLTAALSLHAAGFTDVRVVESAQELRPLGVGLNLLPNAVRELAELGVLSALSSQAVATRELILCNSYGQLVWRESRGLAAGNAWPQLSIHRGHLQAVLADAVTSRLGDHAIATGSRVTAITPLPGNRVRAHLDHPSTANTSTLEIDLLIGADGINSAVRKALYPLEGPPLWNGLTLWRGVACSEPYLTGASMIVAGDDVERIVLYPIQERIDGGKHTTLVNWVIARRCGEEPQHGDWNRRTSLDTVVEHARRWQFDWLDIPAIISGSPAVFEYPMIDRDPLPRWTFQRVTLLGDAAHPMYPAGSNGATQAIIDARALAYQLATCDDTDQALDAYDRQRRKVMAQIQLSNRAMGPERAITLAHQRAPCGFSDINDVIPASELEQISADYAQIAGFDPDACARQSPYNANWSTYARQ